MSKNKQTETFLQHQLNLMVLAAIHSRKPLPQLYATCTECTQPTPQNIFMDGDSIKIEYPCTNPHCHKSPHFFVGQKDE